MEIGAEAAQFPEKEYVSGKAVAVHSNMNDENMNDNREIMFGDGEGG